MPRVRRPAVLAWAVVVAGLLAGVGQAQPVATPEIGFAPNPIGSGARAMGQGNAFIAVADDATAANWNPGGLSQLQRPEASLALEHLRQGESMASDLYPEAESDQAISLSELNYASLVYPIYLHRHMVLSLSYLRQFRFDRSLRYPLRESVGGVDVDAHFRYLQEGTFATLSPAFGIDLTPHLSLGLTLNVWNEEITGSSAYEQHTTTTGRVQYGPFQDTFRHRIRERFEVREGYSLVLGSLYRFNEAWTLGVVLKPAYTLHLDHTRAESYTETGTLTPPDESWADASKSDADLHMPWVAGAGVAWRPSDLLTVSTDVTWTDWSNCTYNENGRETNPLTIQPVSRSELDDTYTARVGLEYLILRDAFVVPLRCGAGYDPAPAVDGVDRYYSLTCGTGLEWGRFVFDLAYEFRWGHDVTRDTLTGIRGGEDTVRHRILASLIRYF